MLWSLDRLGYGSWIDDPLTHEAKLLPLARASALWIWLAALSLTAYWSRLLYGPGAHGGRGLVVRAQPESSGTRRFGDDGTAHRRPR